MLDLLEVSADNQVVHARVTDCISEVENLII